MSSPPPSTGLTRRRQRISDQETEQRMLQAALAMVNRAGLTVSLDHISFEDVIREAGVARSAVYRKWPYKDLFFSDLLKELATGATPAIAGNNPESTAATTRALLDHLDWLRTPDLRRALAAEALRQGALTEFQTFDQSPEWRTYFALQATFRSLPESELRDEIQHALTEADHALITRLAATYQAVSHLLGLRLRPEIDTGFDTLATLASATIRGLILMAPTHPAIASDRFQANPFGAPAPAEWTQPALGIATMILSFLEVDPDVEWTDKRIADIRSTLHSGNWAPR
ncbi:TetR/AcrR family transcriptional regulator [Nocardia sp. NPDC051756]|uniref:TetR/AcrR family transcriptional regulator n=1 Tax=Nocardia sp. NPDC051756 TaxID=3154751 RepID=UPI00343D5095